MEGRGRKTESGADFFFPLLVSISIVKRKVRAQKERRKRAASAPAGLCLMREAPQGLCSPGPWPTALRPQPTALGPQPRALSPWPIALSPQPRALSPRPSARRSPGSGGAPGSRHPLAWRALAPLPAASSSGRAGRRCMDGRFRD